MAKIEIFGTPTTKAETRAILQIMSGNGHDTLDFDANDEKSMKDIIAKICAALEDNKDLWAGREGSEDLEVVANKNDLKSVSNLEKTLNDKAYERFMLAAQRGDRLLIGATPKGG